MSAAEALVGVAALAGDLLGQVRVLVPAAMEELDEAHAALGQPAGQQAVGGEGAGLARVGAVQGEGVRGLAREVGQLGHRGLHPVGQLVLGDPRGDLGVAELVVPDLVEPGQVVEHPPPGVGVEPGGIGQVQHRVADGAELDALVLRRQEAAAPEAVVERLIGRVARALRDHARRTPAGRRSRCPGRRRARRRCSGRPASWAPGLEEGDGRVVVDRLGVHRLDEAEVVGDALRCAAAAR